MEWLDGDILHFLYSASKALKVDKETLDEMNESLRMKNERNKKKKNDLWMCLFVFLYLRVTLVWLTYTFLFVLFKFTKYSRTDHQITSKHVNHRLIIKSQDHTQITQIMIWPWFNDLRISDVDITPWIYKVEKIL